MAEEARFLRSKISTDTMYDTLKTHTKYALSIRGRPTLMQAQKKSFFRTESPNERRYASS